MNAETIVLALTLLVTLTGTGAVLYARLVRIETLMRSHGSAIKRLWKRSERVTRLESRVTMLESARTQTT